MALWKASISPRTLSCPNLFRKLSHSLLFTFSFAVIISNVGFSHALPVSGYLVDTQAGVPVGGDRTNVENGGGVIHSFETSVVSIGILLSLVVFAVLCTGGCCLNIFGKRRGEDVPATGFSNPIAELGSSAATISPIDVRALEMNPIVFEPLPTIHDLTPVSTNFYNSLHRVDSSSRYTRHLSPDSQSSNYLGIGAAAAIVPTDESSVYAHDWFDEPYRNFPRGHIEYVKEVGKGWFGKVIEAEAEDIVPFTKKLRVLVKVLREDATGTEQMRFLDESRVYRDANHGNVLKLLGHSIETLPFLLIMEHCPQGDLKSFLIANVGRAELLNTQGALIRMALDIAKGLEWMASADFIHKDLAARNCQVGSEGRVIIGDYGLATQSFRDDYYWGQNVAIPLRWSAPETLHCTINTIQTLKVLKSSNVWTFGVVVWEICEFGKLPYYELSDDDVISRVITDKNYTLNQLTRPGLSMKDELYKVMLSCWNPRPEFRPSMSSIVEQMEAIFNGMNINSSTGVSSNSATPSASGMKSTKDDFDKRWEDLANKTNSPRDPEELYSPSWDNSTSNSIGSANAGISKKKSVSFVGMQEELPSVQIKVGNSVTVQQSELPIKFKNLAQVAQVAVESHNLSLFQFNNKETSLKTSSVDSEPPRDTTPLVLLPHSNAKEEGNMWKVNGDIEDESWRQRIESGEISQKVKEKSQSVQDLMVLTHVEPSEFSDPDSLVIISQGQLKNSVPLSNSNSSSLEPNVVGVKTININNTGNLRKSNSETAINSSSSLTVDSISVSLSSSANVSKTDKKTSNVLSSSVHSPPSGTVSKHSGDTSTSSASDPSKFEIGVYPAIQSYSASEELGKNNKGSFTSDMSLPNKTTTNKTLFSISDLSDRRGGTTSLDDCTGLSIDFQGGVQNTGSKSDVKTATSSSDVPISVSNLDPGISISNQIHLSKDLGTHGRASSISGLPFRNSEESSELASLDISNSYSTSHEEQSNGINSNAAKQLSATPLQFSVPSAPSNLSNGGKSENSSSHTSDGINTLTPLAPNLGGVPSASNAVTPISLSYNGQANPISNTNLTEFDKSLPPVPNQKVNFILPDPNNEPPTTRDNKSATKGNKIHARSRKTSTPNNSPGVGSSYTDDSDFFQRSDDIFEDFSMELSEHLSPIKKAEGVPPSLLTSNASINYNNFHVLMGPSEDLGLMPYQRVTTQIEREMSGPTKEILTDCIESDNSGILGPSTLGTTTTSSNAECMEMWLSNQESQVRSKSGFNDIFGAGRPKGDTPVYQGTFTPEVSESIEQGSNFSRPVVARKLMFQSDASIWDGGDVNSTGKIIETGVSLEPVSRISDQDASNSDNYETYNSICNSTDATSSSLKDSDLGADKCVTIIRKPYGGSSSYDERRNGNETSYPEPKQEAQFKLGHDPDNDHNVNLGIAKDENAAKDKFVEDIETAVEEFGSLVLADLEEENSKVEVIKETREEDPFYSEKSGSGIIRVAKHAFSDTTMNTTTSSSTTEADTLETHLDVGTDEHTQSEVSVLTSNTSQEPVSGSALKPMATDLDESDNAEEDDNDDESICREFVPSKWNQNLAPVKPAIKSPEQQKVKETAASTPSSNSVLEKSGLKKSVSFERIRKKTQLVYEYPPPPPTSDSDDEEKHGKSIGTGGGHFSLSLDWELQPEELENTDAHQDDWEEDFTQSRPDNPMDMYRFSGFENFQVRPSVEPFEFQRDIPTPNSAAQLLEASVSSIKNALPPSSAGSGTSTLGELRHTRSRLKLDLTKGEASLLDSERERAAGDTAKLATSKLQHVDSGVGSISSTNVSPFTHCDNN